ncbi:MAG: hypothetical protein V3S89_07325 [Desulfobacterales bacterium]
MKTGLVCILLAVSSVLFGACSIQPARIPDPGIHSLSPGSPFEIRDLLSGLAERNSTLRTFKGVGRFTLWQGGGIQTRQRAAWAGAVPGSFRMVVLASGRPVIKLACNGKWLTYHDLRPSPSVFSKVPVINGSLKRLVSIPIRANDLLTLLTGRIPVHRHHSARFIRHETDEGDVLVLKKWWRIREKIHFTKNTNVPYKVEVFDLAGSLLYSAQLERIQQVDSFQIPMKITITDGTNQAGIQLIVDRYMPNVTVAESMFVLSPPG